MLQRGGEQVSLHMMDAEQRNVARECKRFSIAHSYEQRTHQSGGVGDCNRVQIIETGAGFAQRAIDDWKDAREMRPRRNLRDDAPKYSVNVLRKNYQGFLGDVVAVALENSRRRFVARSLDAEDSGHPYCSVSSRSTSARASGEFQSVAVMSFFLMMPSLPTMNVSG